MTLDEIEVRDYERKQLLEFLPRVVEDYREQDTEEMRDRADELEAVVPEFETEIGHSESAEYDLGADTWDLIAGALDSLEETRASWLRAKLARRGDMRAVRMGFTTRVPAGVLMTSETPDRSADEA